jgi:predicted PurR-regulated permease PerM
MHKTSKRQILRFCIFCAALLVVFWSFYSLYFPLLIPFGISLFLSYLLAPFVAFWHRAKIPRSVVVFLLVGISISIGAIACVSIIPGLYSEVMALVRSVPGVLDTAMQTWVPAINAQILELDFISQEQLDVVVKEIREFVRFSDQLHQAMLTVLRTAPQVLGTVMNIILVPLFTFFLLKDFEENKAKFYSLVPRDILAPFHQLMMRIGLTLRRVIKGQMIVAAIVGVLYIVGFSIIGLPSALVIGAVAGICRIIPYLDVVVGGSLGVVALLANFHSWGQLLGLLLVFVIVQSVDGIFITPRIIGKQSGLHPFVVIISVISFAQLFGFWGVLLAVPVIAVVKVIIMSAIPVYKASPAFDPRNKFSDEGK